MQLARDARSLVGCNGGSDLETMLASTHAALKQHLHREDAGLAREE